MKIPSRLLAGALLLAFPCLVQASHVILSEVMYNPAGTKAEWIEVTNTTTNRLDMAVWQLTSGASLTLPDFAAGTPTAHFLKERERIILSSKSAADTRLDYPNIPANVRIFGPWVGALDNAGEVISLRDKNGALLTQLDYGDSGRKWPTAPDGTGHSLVMINENKTLDDWHNWNSSPTIGGSPGSPDVQPTEEAINDPSASLPLVYSEAVPMTATWNFYKEVAAPPANWNALSFVPSAPWGSGPALLGFETAALPAPGLLTAVQTGDPGAGTNLLSYYFRKNFTWTGGAGGAQFQMDTILDDGATFYLNGTYIGNKDGLVNVVHNAVNATTTVTDATLVTNAVIGTIPPGLLQEGNNVLAAVGHQISLTSSDMIFGANLRLANAPAADLLINEVRQSGAGVGFIEFYNPGAVAINLQGYNLTDTSGAWTKFPITQSIVVPAGGLATIGLTESGFSSTIATLALYLSRPNGTPITGLVAALPQDGRSVGRKPAGSSSWYRFSQPTPGQPNSSASTASAATTTPNLNEVHFSSSTKADWVELANNQNAPMSLAGLALASNKAFTDKVNLTGSIPAHGYASATVNFALNTNGEATIYLLDASNNVLAEAQVQRRNGKSSTQAWPIGVNEWYPTTTATRDAINAPDRNSSIVISEIMYAPPSDHRQGEFIELTNRSGAAVSVGGWSFSSGISYTIPTGTSIAAGGRLVVAQDAAFITANYPAATVVGDYGGSLSNSGELIRLVDATGSLADEVDYQTGGDWPRQGDSLGSSIELINVNMDNDCGSSWAGSDDTQKGQWTAFSYSGFWSDQGPGGVATDRNEIHMNLTGDGHIVLRNISFTVNGTPTAIPATVSAANSGIDAWRVTGTHWATYGDAEGLHIVADGAGDMKGNAIEKDVPFTLTASTYGITFEARWVSGSSRLVMNSWDRTWGRTFAVPMPNGLGTPGAPNSRAAALAAPEIWSMLHSPAVPKATDNVIVTARVTSSLPLNAVSVWHRLDILAGNGAWTTSPMNDAGTGGDAVAGDGIYSATISSYKTEGAIAQFYIQASATGGGTATYPAGGASLPGMWIVDSSPVSSDLLVERFVVAQRDHDAMANGATATYNYRHPRMSNHYYNATFIVNEKEITYNVEARKSGSPWTRDGGNSMDRIRTKFPKDRMFRGREKTGADNDASDPGARRWNNRVDRYWLYLLGYPAAEAEFIQVQFNNLGLSLKDDTEPTDTDLLARTYDNPGSTELHEVDDAWYFTDDLIGEGRSQIDGNWQVDARWYDSAVFWQGSWPMRTQVERYDYSPLTSWIRTMYNNGITPANDAEDNTYRASVENQFDVDKFGRYAAVKAWAGSWDNFTINRGKNGYVYRRPTDGKWEFEFWDGDLDFANTGEAVLGGIAGTGVFFGRPWFRRSMNYYLQEIRDKWSLNSPRMYAWLQAMEDQSSSYDIVQDFYKTWFANRRTSIDAFIGTGNQTSPFTATASVGAATTLNFTNLTGTAPTQVSSITVTGHPEGVFRWLTASTWQITGIALRSGSNLLSITGTDRQGVTIGSTTVLVTKTGDAPPVLVIVSDPASMNASLGEAVVVDSTGSFDPEGTALTLAWSITPTSGVSITNSGATGKRYLFSTPGIYTVTLNGTDGAASVSSLARQITIYSTADFASFGSSLLLAPNLTATNTELRDNSSPTSSYSLEDSSGRLLLQVNEAAAAPLDSTTFPSITRPLPTTADWVMQTDVHLDARHLGGDFDTGLMVDTVENGLAVRYVYALETGDQVRVRRDDPNGVFYIPATGNPTPFRINCGGPQVTEADSRVWTADNYFLSNPATTTVAQSYVSTAQPNYTNVLDSRRTGISGGSITYEFPVPAWSYSLTLYSNVIASPSQTINMNVYINDGTAAAWSANSSSSIMRTFPISSVTRNGAGNIKINIAIVSATSTVGAQATISAIELVPIAPTAAVGLPALTPAPMTADSLRIQRSGNSLIFSRKVAGAWIVDQTQTLPTGTTAVKGGIFASTETPMNLRASFDYLLIADPAKASSVLAGLRLTEVMYNPASDSVEYLEFRNTGSTPVSLLGVNFPATTPFAAYTFGNESLAPGEFIILTGNPAGFRQKYSVSPRLAISPWSSGSLDNGGEHIIVNDPDGNAIHDFTYDDVAPWPLTPDGQGPSLEIIDYNGDYNNPLNWRASASSDGTPGGTTRLTDPDTDGDGIADWVENAFGLASNSPGQKPQATTSMTAGQVTIAWPFTAGKSYNVEWSSDLQIWQTLGTVTGAGSLPDPASPTEGRRYYRVTALPYP